MAALDYFVLVMQQSFELKEYMPVKIIELTYAIYFVSQNRKILIDSTQIYELQGMMH